MTASTSIAALKDIKPKAPSIRERIFDAIKSTSTGVSRTQLAILLDLNEITVGSRITELYQAGKITRLSETVLSTSGKQESLYVQNTTGYVGIATRKKRPTAKNIARELRTLGVTSDKVMDKLYWAATETGSEFWADLHSELQKLEGKE